jgi:hypothetical protein
VNARDKTLMTAAFYAAPTSLRVIELLVANGTSTVHERQFSFPRRVLIVTTSS